jgi:ComF family protein
LDCLRVVAPFSGVLQEAIHHLKYRNVKGLARPLGDLLANQFQATSIPADIIVPVPLHKERERERGYNQAALLASRLAQRAALPIADRALERVRRTPPQVGLSARERWANMAGAFRCAGSDLRGRRVLLVDDVCSTGATLSACAQASRDGGAVAIYALTLARPF